MSHHSHHHHGHDHHAVQSFNTAFAIAISITLSYTAIEAGYAIYANAMSLLADAIHNLGDVLGLLFAWGANWLLTRPAKQRYSYGYKRTTILAALSNAFILVATSVLAAYESIQKLIHPSEVKEDIIIIVGLIGVLVNIFASLLFMRGAREDVNIKAAFIHLMADAFILLGVVISAIIILYTQWLWIDPIISLLIIGIVLYSTWGLLRTSLALMLDAIPPHIDEVAVKTFLSEYTGVEAVHDLHIWGLSTREVALTAHLVMPEKQLNDQDYAKINKILREKFAIHHVTLQVESGHQADPCGRKITC